jgi:hypothetical protein
MAEKAVHWKKEGTPGFLATAAGMATAATLRMVSSEKVSVRAIQIFVQKAFRK